MTYTPEVEQVVQYRFLGRIYQTEDDAQKMRALHIMQEAIGTDLDAAMRLNPRHVAAVLTEYADAIDRIDSAPKAPRICEANFIAPDTIHVPFGYEPVHDWWDMCIACRDLWQKSERIKAIKLVRACFGQPNVDLKETKDWVEAHCK